MINMLFWTDVDGDMHIILPWNVIRVSRANKIQDKEVSDVYLVDGTFLRIAGNYQMLGGEWQRTLGQNVFEFTRLLAMAVKGTY